MPDTAPTGPGSDLTSILELLQLQKSESEKRNDQLMQLQQQVSALTLNRAPATIPTPPTLAVPTAPPFPTPSPHVTAPQGVSSSGQHNYGYTGLNMEQPGRTRASTWSSQAVANGMLASSTFSVPPLNPIANPLAGMGASHGANQVTSLDQLYHATTVNKQLCAFEFAATGQFPYTKVN